MKDKNDTSLNKQQSASNKQQPGGALHVNEKDPSKHRDQGDSQQHARQQDGQQTRQQGAGQTSVGVGQGNDSRRDSQQQAYQGDDNRQPGGNRASPKSNQQGSHVDDRSRANDKPQQR